MGPIQMHNPKAAEGHRDMSVPPERVQEFTELGWEIVGDEAAAPAEAESSEPSSDARRKPRKATEQS